MADYLIGELAQMAGVSLRTLRYYDQIGLLVPSRRADNGYRRYGRQDLIRLQQILLYRELELPLTDIKDILDAPGFHELPALISHRQRLTARRDRLERLLATLDRTISSLKEEDVTLSDEQLYEGFTPEQAERYQREARERWGEQVDEVEGRLRRLSSKKWQQIKQEGEEAARDVAELMDRSPSDDLVQEAVRRHHQWIEHFYPAPAPVYLGLSDLYIEHEEFKAYYDDMKPGLAEFLSNAMKLFAQRELG